EFVGSDSKKAQAALHAAAAQPKPAVTISVEKQEAAEIQLRLNLPESMRLSKDQQADWIVAVTEDDLTSQVQRGENVGRKLRHVAVVRMLKSAGVLSKADDMKVGYAIVPLQKEWDRS